MTTFPALPTASRWPPIIIASFLSIGSLPSIIPITLHAFPSVCLVVLAFIVTLLPVLKDIALNVFVILSSMSLFVVFSPAKISLRGWGPIPQTIIDGSYEIFGFAIAPSI